MKYTYFFILPFLITTAYATECDSAVFLIEKLDKLIKIAEDKGQDPEKYLIRRGTLYTSIANCNNAKHIKPRAIKASSAPNTLSSTTPQSCTYIDLRNKLGPIKSQGKTGWCFAYTAADLLSVKLGKKVSALSVAINYKTDGIFSLFDRLKGNSPFRTGEIDSAIMASKDKLCLESELPSDLGNIDIEKVIKNVNDKKITVADCLSLGEILPANQVSPFVKIAKKLTERESIKELAARSCKTKITQNFEAAKIKQSNFINEMNRVLKQNQIVGINIDPRFWEEGTRYKGKTFDHAASVIGRKWDATTNSCLYLVRDSTTQSCEPYNSIYKCEKGHTWVPASTLVSNTESSFYIK